MNGAALLSHGSDELDRCLLTDADSSSATQELIKSDNWLLNETEMMKKEVPVAEFQVPPRNFPGGDEDSHEKPQDDRYSNRNSNHAPSERAKVDGKNKRVQVFNMVKITNMVFRNTMLFDITSHETVIVSANTQTLFSIILILSINLLKLSDNYMYRQVQH